MGEHGKTKNNYVIFFKNKNKTFTMEENESNLDLKGIEGLTVYDQDKFEQKVSKNLSRHVEKQQREHDTKRLTSELKNVTENLTKSIENLSKVEKSLNDAIDRGITSDRRLQVFLEQQQKFTSEIKKLTESQNENETDQSDKETETETKQEKSIRLGQMTAFGKVL